LLAFNRVFPSFPYRYTEPRARTARSDRTAAQLSFSVIGEPKSIAASWMFGKELSPVRLGLSVVWPAVRGSLRHSWMLDHCPHHLRCAALIPARAGQAQGVDAWLRGQLRDFDYESPGRSAGASRLTLSNLWHA